MATRRVSVILEAQSSGMVRGLEQAGAAADKAASRIDKITDSVSAHEAALTNVGGGLAAFGAAGAASLGMAAKAAVDWETAWAGVTKTVDGSDAQMAELESGLRDLATTLPATHTEIAAVAEAAGQLGIRREDILSFTETMIALGETTNLTADEAATAIAQISNVMGTSGADVDNFASTLVALGNAGASTEKEILDMAQRLSGAGAMIGATEGEVLALANAMASMGIESQLGGSAMSRAMIQMNSAVKGGGDTLEAFAQVSGMTAEQFAAAWNSDPVSAVQAFVGGLDGIQASGGDAAGALRDVGLKGTENAQVFLRLAGGADVLASSLELQAQAWAENTALADEASKRYDTVASQMQVAKNNITDAAIDFGAVMMPGIVAATDGISGFAQVLADLPSPIQGTITGLAGAGSGLALLGGGLALALPKVMEARRSFKELADWSPRAASGIEKAGKAASLATAGFVALQIAASAVEDADPAGIEQTTAALLDMADATDFSGASLDSLFQNIEGSGQSFGTFEEALNRVANPDWDRKIQDMGDSFFGIKNTAMAAEEQIGNIGEALAQMVNEGNGDQAAAMFDEMAARAQAAGVPIEDLMAMMPAYQEALAGVDNEARQAAGGTDALGAAAAGVPGQMDPATAAIEAAKEEAEAAQEAIDALSDSLGNAGGPFLSARDAARGYQEALDSATASIEENGQAHNIASEAGRANQAALDGLATSTHQYAQATFDLNGSAGETAAVIAEGRQAFLDTAEAMGYSADEARNMADAAGLIPDNIEMRFEAAGIDGVQGEINSVADYAKTREANIQLGADYGEAEVTVDNFVYRADEKEATIGVDADPTQAVATADATVAGIGGKEAQVDITANPAPAQATAAQAVAGISAGSKALVEMFLNPAPAQATAAGTLAEIDARTTTPEMGMNVDQALAQVATTLFNVDNSSATSDMYMNTGPADSSVASTLANTEGASATADMYMNTGPAAGAVATLLNSIPRSITVAVSAVTSGASSLGSALRGALGRADGGPITGVGGPRDDNILVAASNGEHMLTAAEVDAAGGHDAIYRMRRAILDGDMRYDVGGAIGASRPARAEALGPRLTTMAQIQAPKVQAGAQTAVLDPAPIAAQVAAAVSASMPDRFTLDVGGRQFDALVVSAHKRAQRRGAW